MSEPQEESRLDLEIQLLQSMYPEQVAYNAKHGDLTFADERGQLQLRIPAQYPEEGRPEVILARNASGDDIRDRVKLSIRESELQEGEEALDAIVNCFLEVASAADDLNTSMSQAEQGPVSTAPAQDETSADKTIIIWLHHLLALSKRKLALAPSSSGVSGVTKPGYPGIMLFTGRASAVDEHVRVLKAENWQAFQVRYEEEGIWELEHGNGIREVESMAEVVKVVGERKEVFLRAVGIK